ncbi:MAG: hypothetical protein WBD46_07035 [Acidobacteriaceae bacterium]
MGTSENVQALISRSLRSRVMVAYALCAVAEGEMRDGQLERALKTIQAVRKLIAEIAMLVSEPNTTAPNAIREAGEMLGELESRIASVEAAIGQE